MVSKITFAEIKHIVVKSYQDISKTDLKEGILTSRNITKEFIQGDKIDVFAVKTLPTLICGDSFEIDVESIIAESVRQFYDLTNIQFKKGKLPVHTDFYKCLDKNDTIIIILHSICHQKL